jgi:hypothetical protein
LPEFVDAAKKVNLFIINIIILKKGAAHFFHHMSKLLDFDADLAQVGQDGFVIGLKRWDISMKEGFSQHK